MIPAALLSGAFVPGAPAAWARWWRSKSVLITGGTGTFGNAAARRLLADGCPRVVIYSRDERKQLTMRDAGVSGDRVRYFVGDVRDRQRLRRAMDGVDVVVHAAALKQVESCEYNPLEATKTNVGGAENVVEAALDAGVRKVVGLSTDKAVHPANLYGATKMVAERLLLAANAYGGNTTRFACVRYGNVLGSRGSVLDRVAAGKEVLVPHARMTRFWTTPAAAVATVLRAVADMDGGEVFVPALRAARVYDVVLEAAGVLRSRPALRSATWPGPRAPKVGGALVVGEKLHEVLVSEDELARTSEWFGAPIDGAPPGGWIVGQVQFFAEDAARKAPLRSDTAEQMTPEELYRAVRDALTALGDDGAFHVEQ